MAGGGGDAPPLPESNGGEFLLSLLQKAPHHHYHQEGRSPQPQPQPQPQQSPVIDPAVGHTLPFQQQIQPPWRSASSNGRDHPHHHQLPNPSSSSSVWPNSQSPPPPPFNFLGFPQNPLPSPPTANHFPQFGGNQFPANLAEDFREIGFSSPNNPIQNVAQKQHQEQRLKFSYLPSDIIRNPESSVNANTSSEVAELSNGLRENLRLNSNNSSSSNDFRRVNHDSGEQESRGGGVGGGGGRGGERGKQFHRTIPPPGFGNKPRGGGNWDGGNRRGGMEHNVDRERQNSSEFARNKDKESRFRGNGANRMGLSAQLDWPGPPAGTSLHSVSASKIEESMMNLEDGNRVGDASQQLPEDERDGKNEGKQHHKVKPFSITIYVIEVLNIMEVHKSELRQM